MGYNFRDPEIQENDRRVCSLQIVGSQMCSALSQILSCEEFRQIKLGETAQILLS